MEEIQSRGRGREKVFLLALDFLEPHLALLTTLRRDALVTRLESVLSTRLGNE